MNKHRAQTLVEYLILSLIVLLIILGVYNAYFSDTQESAQEIIIQEHEPSVQTWR